MQRIFLTEGLLAFQEGLCSTALVNIIEKYQVPSISTQKLSPLVRITEAEMSSRYAINRSTVTNYVLCRLLRCYTLLLILSRR